MYVLHSKWFSSYSQISQVLWVVVFLLSASTSCKSRREQSVLCPTSWSTTLILNFFVLLVMCLAFVFTDYEFLKSWVYCTKSQSSRLISFVCKVIYKILRMCYYHCCCDYWMFWWKQEFKIISPFWSAALVSLVHRKPLCEYCSLVDQGALEGNAPSAIKWSTALGVEFWAQLPPHTQIWPVFNLLADWYVAHTVQKFCASTTWSSRCAL